MLRNFTLWNFPAGAELGDFQSKHGFMLKTCQRTIVLSFHHQPFPAVHSSRLDTCQGLDAYIYLLEIICGLKSKLVGENEIVGQFKEAYQLYAMDTERDPKIMLILEKLFKDAKLIRTEHLSGFAHKTYASLTRKHITKFKPNAVLILGSGKLAEDLINQFKKKCPIYIAARNSARVQELVLEHQITAVDFNHPESWKNFAFIANTIGFEGTLLAQDFLASWQSRHTQKLMVDLGAPSCIHSTLSKETGLIRLSDILEEGAVLESFKETQIEHAKKRMKKLAQERMVWLEEKQLKWHPRPTLNHPTTLSV